LTEDEKPYAQSKLKQSLYALSHRNISEFTLARNPFENIPVQNLGKKLHVKKIGRRTFQEDRLKQMLENQPKIDIDNLDFQEYSENFSNTNSSHESKSGNRRGGNSEQPLKPGGFYDDDNDYEDDGDKYLSPAPQSVSSQKRQQQQQQQISEIKDKFSSEIKGAEKKVAVKVIRKIKVIKKVKNS